MNQDVKALPECFEFAMEFLGDPEAPEIRAYIEQQNATIAELRAEVERLRDEHRHLQYRIRDQRSSLRDEIKRADTAEARLERATGLLDLASRHVKSNARLKNAIAAFLGEGK